ncbi:MAG: hypothetical protein AAF367_10470 [Pseudomonadota bacterium]
MVPRDPDIGQLYRYTNEIDPALRRPLVTIPGLLGSRLRVGKDGEFVWGGPNRISIDTGNDRGAGLLALPVGDGTEPLSSLRDEIRPAGVLRRARAQVLFAQVQQEIYSNLVTALNSGGYEFSRTLEEERARQGENPGSLEFPYDWRRDIVESARELDDFIERKAVQIERVRRERFGRSVPADELRFDFVAHSMGGLVLRYWLMYGRQDLPADGSLPELTWAGARRAACVVFVAPPNLGSISAFDNLLTGRSFGPLQPFYRPALLATLPSLYQLMPRDRHQRVTMSGNGSPVDSIYDADTWRQRGWGLFASGEEEFISLVMPDAKSPAARQDIAQRHMTRVLGRAEALHRALDVPGTPRLTDLFLVVGTGLDTPAAATVDRDSGTATISAQEEGDGVVLRASALRDENQGGHVGTGPSRPIRYRTTLLLPGEHVEITASPVFADNLLHWLRDQPRARVSAG